MEDMIIVSRQRVTEDEDHIFRGCAAPLKTSKRLMQICAVHYPSFLGLAGPLGDEDRIPILIERRPDLIDDRCIRFRPRII